MLAVQDISVQFGGEVLFADMSFMVNKGDRIGLVGKNGARKSTLLKIIHSNNGFDSGSVNLQKEMKVGYLSQDIDFVKGCTVLEEAEKAFERIKEVQKQLYLVYALCECEKRKSSFIYSCSFTKHSDSSLRRI